MSKNGRPSVLDDHKKDIICAVACVGGSIRQAAQIIECSEGAIRYCLAHDEAFAARFAKSQATAQLGYLRNIKKNSNRSWRASAWALERLCPDEFGSAQERLAARQPQSQGPGAPPAMMDLQSLSQFDDPFSPEPNPDDPPPDAAAIPA